MNRTEKRSDGLNLLYYKSPRGISFGKKLFWVDRILTCVLSSTGQLEDFCDASESGDYSTSRFRQC